MRRRHGLHSHTAPTVTCTVERAHQRHRVLAFYSGSHEREGGSTGHSRFRSPRHARASGPRDTNWGQRLGWQCVGERQLVERRGGHLLQGLRRHQSRRGEPRRHRGMHGQRADGHLHGEQFDQRHRVLLHRGGGQRRRQLRVRPPESTPRPESSGPWATPSGGSTRVPWPPTRRWASTGRATWERQPPARSSSPDEPGRRELQRAPRPAPERRRWSPSRTVNTGRAHGNGTGVLLHRRGRERRRIVGRAR